MVTMIYRASGVGATGSPMAGLDSGFPAGAVLVPLGGKIARPADPDDRARVRGRLSGGFP
ncbi:hypothetical protein [Nonomuraea sp. NPDC049400]|uniref:hypothetical protein n=1 Tax=Nonomuraea sp. NPDC049400 TaxID=3364352 RepID=UPI0037BCFD79